MSVELNGEGLMNWGEPCDLGADVEAFYEALNESNLTPIFADACSIDEYEGDDRTMYVYTYEYNGEYYSTSEIGGEISNCGPLYLRGRVDSALAVVADFKKSLEVYA